MEATRIREVDATGAIQALELGRGLVAAMCELIRAASGTAMVSAIPDRSEDAVACPKEVDADTSPGAARHEDLRKRLSGREAEGPGGYPIVDVGCFEVEVHRRPVGASDHRNVSAATPNIAEKAAPWFYSLLGREDPHV